MPIRILLVDDSALFRSVVKRTLSAADLCEVVGEAGSGEEALRAVPELRPDVILMDLELPGKNGYEITSRLAGPQGAAIIILSGGGQSSAEMTLNAIASGAVDFVHKPSGQRGKPAFDEELLRKVTVWGQRQLRRRTSANQSIPGTATDSVVLKSAESPPRSPWPNASPDLLVVGASTGGPRAVIDLFKRLPPLPCPAVIALHMPPLFTASFAESLMRESGHPATEAHHGQALQRSQVLVAPGGTDTEVYSRPGLPGELHVRTQRKGSRGIHPRVDDLFRSAAEAAQRPVAVIMTGMGDDGLEGSRALREHNFPVLAQAESDCVVYGMPKAVVERGLATYTGSIEMLAATLAHWCRH